MGYDKEVHKALWEMTDEELEYTINYRMHKVVEWEDALDRAYEEKDKRG